MSALSTLICCVAVSAIWGITNVLIKRSTKEITKIQASNWLDRFINELKYLIVNWRYLLPFAANQLGSVLFYVVLLFSEISLVVPVTNSLTFLATAGASVYFGESVPSRNTIVGSVFVLTGITCCVVDKLSVQ